MAFDMATIGSFVIQGLVAIGSVAVFLASRFGERLVAHPFDAKLENLKHEQNAKIESLKTELAHVIDRGQRSNEREYDALSQVWEKSIDAYYATNTAAISFLEYPNLDQMSDEEVSSFLSTTEFSEGQRKQVMDNNDRNTIYSRLVTLRQINAARLANHEVRKLLLKREIFIPAELSQKLLAFMEMLSAAEVERYVQFSHRDYQGEKVNYFLQNGEPRLKELGSAVRARLMSV